MKKFSSSFLFPILLLATLVFALSNSIFILPPMGKILSPFIGIMQHENNLEPNHIINIPQCKKPIKVYFDQRSVPHVFAETEQDMFLAQGYITAKDRLWQMDFISYASAGRLSEIFGDGYLNYDRFQRRIGMLASAKSTLNMMEQNKETKLALDAYTIGINAFIASLNYKDFPFEYKLMDYKPEAWTNLKSVLVMKYISAMLSGYDEDIAMSHLFLNLGEKEFRKLFPDQSVLDTNYIKSNQLLNLEKLPFGNYINYSFLSNKSQLTSSKYNPRLGSNNWAINGFKSSSGSPILCSDPHLNLSLPSIWYEIQLSSPTTNVYGVSIPGTVGVIIGFNKNIAWGLTNGATDARDWYKLKLKDGYSAYEIDGKWKNTKKSIEIIKIKNHATFFDTIYATEHGPIVIDNTVNEEPGAKNFALKWTLHEPSNEFLTFILLNKANNYLDFKKAIASYQCPIQNFVFASATDTIAIHHKGKIYEKWNAQGKFLLDGTKSTHLYTQTIIDQNLPKLYNPKNGFVYSANNYPNFDTCKYYINGYYSEARASSIKSKLSEKNKWSINDMKNLQLDNTDEIAKRLLPSLLKHLGTKKNADEVNTINLLKVWRYDFHESSKAAYFYAEWLKSINELTWDELRLEAYHIKDPSPVVLMRLILFEPNSIYFDCINTNSIESAGDVIKTAFDKTIKTCDSKTWGEHNNVNITHLSKIQALAHKTIQTSGNPEVINAISENWGPSWRMIVELGNRPKAFGIFAGGQSGNPASDKYDAFINDWQQGQYYELKFCLDTIEAKQQFGQPFHFSNLKK